MDLRSLLSDPACTIVDVRTPAEFMGGHVVGSINIPLQEVPDRVEEFRRMARPLVLCCASVVVRPPISWNNMDWTRSTTVVAGCR